MPRRTARLYSTGTGGPLVRPLERHRAPLRVWRRLGTASAALRRLFARAAPLHPSMVSERVSGRRCRRVDAGGVGRRESNGASVEQAHSKLAMVVTTLVTNVLVG